MVMAHMANHETGEAWYGQAAIANALGIDARSVRRRLAHLATIEDSPVRVDTCRRFKPSGEPDSNAWRLVLTSGHQRPVVKAQPEDASVLSSPVTSGHQRPAVTTDRRSEMAAPEDASVRNQRTLVSSDPLSDPLKDPLRDMGEQSSGAAQPAATDAQLVWSHIANGTKRKLSPAREAAIAQALKQLGTVDAVTSYLEAAKAKTSKDWTAAVTSGEPARIFGSYAVELFASEGKLPTSPKAERPDPPAVRAAFTIVRDCYFKAFELERGTAPAFDGSDGRAIKDLLAKCGVAGDPERAAERACDAIEGAFADKFHADKCSIQTIAKDPNKFMGRVPRVQQGGEAQEFRLHVLKSGGAPAVRSTGNPQPGGKLSDFGGFDRG